MDDNTKNGIANDGISLQNTMLLDETTSIDWDAVLRDFIWAHAVSEREAQESLSTPFSLGESGGNALKTPSPFGYHA